MLDGEGAVQQMYHPGGLRYLIHAGRDTRMGEISREDSVIWGTPGGRGHSSSVPLEYTWQEDPWVSGNSSKMNNTIFLNHLPTVETQPSFYVVWPD